MATTAKPTAGQLSEWKASNYPYRMIAAAIARWAADQERGTVLPDDESWGIEASGSTFKRAKRFLVTQGVLEINDGPHFVALRPGGQRPRAVHRVLPDLWDNGFMTDTTEHDDGLSVHLTVRVSRSIATRLRALADERDTSVSKVIRAALAGTREAAP
jgi:predicted transcriptional regulator